MAQVMIRAWPTVARQTMSQDTATVTTEKYGVIVVWLLPCEASIAIGKTLEDHPVDNFGHVLHWDPGLPTGFPASSGNARRTVVKLL